MHKRKEVRVAFFPAFCKTLIFGVGCHFILALFAVKFLVGGGNKKSD